MGKFNLHSVEVDGLIKNTDSQHPVIYTLDRDSYVVFKNAHMKK